MIRFFKRKEKEQKPDLLKPILDGIHLEENQVELIDMIRKGKLKMIYKGKKLNPSWNTAAHDVELWQSPCKRVKFWHEDPGFGSYSYLKINEVEMVDDLKYGTAIALTIQNPKRNYIVSESMHNSRRARSFRIPTFNQFVS